MKIMALIPARAGSKRIPNKNIVPLAGKPLIAYTIEAAGKSKYINRTVVSTDSDKIAAVARKYGAQTPFLRPRKISNVHSTEMQFFDHCLGQLKKNEDYEPDLIVLLYPTAPFRGVRSIDKAVRLMLAHPKADSLRSVRLCSQHPFKMWTINNRRLKPFVKTKNLNTPTFSYQMLPKVYIQTASIYITKPLTLKKYASPIGKVVIPYIMQELEAVDINNYSDLLFAEMLLDKKIIKL